MTKKQAKAKKKFEAISKREAKEKEKFEAYLKQVAKDKGIDSIPFVPENIGISTKPKYDFDKPSPYRKNNYGQTIFQQSADFSLRIGLGESWGIRKRIDRIDRKETAKKFGMLRSWGNWKHKNLEGNNE